MADKAYKSYRQQVGILRSRGMVIGKGSQGSRVMRILERENYYNVSVLKIIRASDGSYTYGTNDAYAIAIMFALLLAKSDLNEFVSLMKAAFHKLQKQLHTIPASDIMSIMGYDENWVNLTKLPD